MKKFNIGDKVKVPNEFTDGFFDCIIASTELVDEDGSFYECKPDWEGSQVFFVRSIPSELIDYR